MADADFLQALHALVEADRAAPGFSGTVAIGVKASPRWYLVEIAEVAKGRFVDTMPDADAWLGLGVQEAQAVLGQARMPDRPHAAVAGDEQLLQRFFDRYVKTNSIVDLMGGSA